MKPRNAKRTIDDFLERARAAHGDRYDYSQVQYLTRRTKVTIICPEHGPFQQEPANHWNGSGCPACAGCKRTTQQDFLARSRAAHGDRYDYSKAEYLGVDSKVTIICPEHGEFEQAAYDHMAGRGCAKCGAAKAVEARRHSPDKFIAAARRKHGSRFDYSRVVYVNSTTPVEIVCPEHGSFWQTAALHADGSGCPLCAPNTRVTKDEFIDRATKVHLGRYSYDGITFVNMGTKVTVMCPDHGAFSTLPKDHVSKATGCPACASERTSSIEESEVADWLRAEGEVVQTNTREPLEGLEIDIYLPERKVGIEYNGAYWHHEGILQHRRIHELKSRRADRKGIRLVTVWDFDWKDRAAAMKQHILHAIGRNAGSRVNARDCKVWPVKHETAKPFYREYHLQGPPWRAMQHIGLFHGLEMAACMSFGQGNSRRGKTGDHEWELLRFATKGLVRGAASKLFAAFIREHNPETVWSFSDRQHFGGGLYRTLGFTRDGDVPADYRVAHLRSGTVWHKSAWKRGNIPARLQELGMGEPYDPKTDPRTERDMQALAGCIRIMDAGKVRWKWQNKTARTEPGGVAGGAGYAAAAPENGTA